MLLPTLLVFYREGRKKRMTATSARLEFRFVGDTFPNVDRGQRDVRDVTLELLLHRIDAVECAVSLAHAVRDA